MYKVYVLESLESKIRYVGMTSQELDQKLKEHNSSATRWTRARRPFKMIYFEQFLTKTEALKREKFFKSGDGRRVLDLKLK